MFTNVLKSFGAAAKDFLYGPSQRKTEPKKTEEEKQMSSNVTNTVPQTQVNNSQPKPQQSQTQVTYDANGNPVITAPVQQPVVQNLPVTNNPNVQATAQYVNGTPTIVAPNTQNDAHVQAFQHNQEQEKLNQKSLTLVKEVVKDLEKEVGGKMANIMSIASIFDSGPSPIDSLVSTSVQNNRALNEAGRKISFQKRVLEDLFGTIQNYLHDVNSNSELRFTETNPQNPNTSKDTLPEVFMNAVMQIINTPNIHSEVKNLAVDKLANLAITKAPSSTANQILQERYEAVAKPISDQSIAQSQNTNAPLSKESRGAAWKALEKVESSSPETIGFVFGIAGNFPWDRLTQQQKNAIDEILIKVFNHAGAANRLIQYNLTSIEERNKRDGYWSGDSEATLEAREVAKHERTKKILTTAINNSQSAVAQGKPGYASAVKLIQLIDSTLATKAPQPAQPTADLPSETNRVAA